jgi:hypothetical protein
MTTTRALATSAAAAIVVLLAVVRNHNIFDEHLQNQLKFDLNVSASSNMLP